MRVSFAEFVLDTAMRQLFRGGDESAPGAQGPRAPGAAAGAPSGSGLEERDPAAALAGHLRVRVEPHRAGGPAAQGAGRRPAAGAFPAHGPRVRLRVQRRDRRPPPGRRRTPARLIWEDSVFLLPPGENLLGRSEEASVRIDAPGVSRRHARVVVTDDGATIEDLGEQERDVRGRAAARRARPRSTTETGCAWDVSSSCSGGPAPPRPPGPRARLPRVATEASRPPPSAG